MSIPALVSAAIPPPQGISDPIVIEPLLILAFSLQLIAEKKRPVVRSLYAVL
jgi:hypothetical protein